MYEQLLTLAKIAPVSIPFAAVVALYIFFDGKRSEQLVRAEQFSQKFLGDSRTLEDLRIVDDYAENMIFKELYQAAVQYHPQEMADKICTILNMLEGMAISVKNGQMNGDLIFAYCGSHILSTVRVLIPFIKGTQTISPNAYINIDALYLDWKSRGNSYEKLRNNKSKWSRKKIRNTYLAIGLTIGFSLGIFIGSNIA